MGFGERGTNLVCKRYGYEPLFKGRAGVGGRDHQESALKNPATFHNEYRFGVAGQALSFRVQYSVPHHDLTVALQPWPITDPADTVLEAARTQRQEPHQLVGYLADQGRG